MEKAYLFFKQIFLHKRMLSLYWRIADMTVVVFADVLIEALTAIQTPNIVVVLVGLVLGEVTKILNKKNK